jgi:HD-GYP domain-containing protein (c-di-GMP phosphodiesterase class II)
MVLWRSYAVCCDYIAINTDRNIRDMFYWIRNELKELVRIDAEYILQLSSLKKLRSLNERWDILINRQAELQSALEHAPSAFEFYNKMAHYKEKFHKEENIRIDLRKQLSDAYAAYNRAMEYINKFDQEHANGAFGASVLSIENARNFWQEKWDEIQTMEKVGDDPNRIINEIDNLVKIIYSAPGLAKWVNEIEKRYSRLSRDHELLVNSFGRALIQQEILDDYSTVINNAIPKLWTHGQKDQLNQYLKELENFLNIYETELETEIAYAERHSIKKGNPTSEQEKQLNNLIELSKIFITAMDIRDPVMSNHSLTVVRLAVATSKIMNWEQEEIRYLEIAAMLHDIGKIWIPESILTKKGKLTSEEIGKIRMHPVYGAQILESSGLFENIIPWIYHHQELWNGTGYPDGLKEEEIPIQSRIISVCEAFDAMLSGNGTKLKLTIEQALDRIRYESGTFFDPIIVEAFIQAVETQEMVYLSKYAMA